jgi:FkbM family methyltransferase
MSTGRNTLLVACVVLCTLLLAAPSLFGGGEEPRGGRVVQAGEAGGRHVVMIEDGGSAAHRLPMAPFVCHQRVVSLHVPRNASEVQRNPANPQQACCTPVKDDIDKGLTMYHTLVRYLCAVHPSPYRIRLAGGGPNAGAGGPAESSEASTPSRIRVLQIGANTGDNENDHLFRFLRQRHWAEAVLLEPVPWLFAKLRAAYKAFEPDVVTLVNAAVGREDGVLPFYAPTNDAPGWVRQMGGFQITPRNWNVLRKKQLTRYIRNTTVQVRSIASVLNKARPGWRGLFPHVVVIDTEGFDAEVVMMLLDALVSARAELAEGGEHDAAAALVIPILQYEWKHLAPAVDAAVVDRLQRLEYCVHRVHYDTLAYHAPTFAVAGPAMTCEMSFTVNRK